MPELKIVINDPKTGKSYPKALDLDLTGRKIGEKIQGSLIGLQEYELEITGGSDTAGFPMRKDIEGSIRKSALLGHGPGINIRERGKKIRKTVRGNTISNLVTQVNLKIVKPGKEPVESALGIEKKELSQEHKSEEDKTKKVEVHK